MTDQSILYRRLYVGSKAGSLLTLMDKLGNLDALVVLFLIAKSIDFQVDKFWIAKVYEHNGKWFLRILN